MASSLCPMVINPASTSTRVDKQQRYSQHRDLLLIYQDHDAARPGSVLIILLIRSYLQHWHWHFGDYINLCMRVYVGGKDNKCCKSSLLSGFEPYKITCQRSRMSEILSFPLPPLIHRPVTSSSFDTDGCATISLPQPIRLARLTKQVCVVIQ